MAFERFKSLFNFVQENQSIPSEGNSLSDLHFSADEAFIDSIDTRIIASSIYENAKD